MNSTTDDILKALNEKKVWHEEQLQRIVAAISALTGACPSVPVVDKPVLLRRRTAPPPNIETVKPGVGRVQWAAEVSKVFVEHDKMKPMDIIDRLAENGVPNLDDKEVKKSVYATLKRKVDQGELVKTEHGEYCRNDT